MPIWIIIYCVLFLILTASSAWLHFTEEKYSNTERHTLAAGEVVHGGIMLWFILSYFDPAWGGSCLLLHGAFIFAAAYQLLGEYNGFQQPEVELIDIKVLMGIVGVMILFTAVPYGFAVMSMLRCW